MDHHRHHDKPAPQGAPAASTARVAYAPKTVVRSAMEKSINSTAKIDGMYWLVVLLTLDRILQAFGVY